MRSKMSFGLETERSSHAVRAPSRSEAGRHAFEVLLALGTLELALLRPGSESRDVCRDAKTVHPSRALVVLVVSHGLQCSVRLPTNATRFGTPRVIRVIRVRLRGDVPGEERGRVFRELLHSFSAERHRDFSPAHLGCTRLERRVIQCRRRMHWSSSDPGEFGPNPKARVWFFRFTRVQHRLDQTPSWHIDSTHGIPHRHGRMRTRQRPHRCAQARSKL